MIQNAVLSDLDAWDGNTPFFQYIAFNNVHSPLEVGVNKHILEENAKINTTEQQRE